MKDTKDNFSRQSEGYANFRPGYPVELFEWIYQQCASFHNAWDCATGNGQAAINLAQKFQLVQATDISINQLENANKADNIIYQCERAEQSTFADNSFDLITVAQSLHWFDHQKYFEEVNRVAKDNCVFAAWGYSLPRLTNSIDSILDEFYTDVVGSYWDKERRYVDKQYSSIAIPFEPLPAPEFSSRNSWSLDQYVGYINTWSATQHYIKAVGKNPTSTLKEQLRDVWNNENYEVCFPIFMRPFIIKK